MGVDFYKRLVTEKAQRNLNYRDLGAVIGKSQDAFRVAVKRKSLTDLEKKAIEKFFGSEQEHHNEIELTRSNRIEDIVAAKVYEKEKPHFKNQEDFQKAVITELKKQAIQIEKMKLMLEKNQSQVLEEIHKIKS